MAYRSSENTLKADRTDVGALEEGAWGQATLPGGRDPHVLRGAFEDKLPCQQGSLVGEGAHAFC